MPRQLTARKTSQQKWIENDSKQSDEFQASLYCDYSNSLTLLNASKLFWSWISKEKENFVTHCLSTSFAKRETRHFHVVVLQWRQRNVQQSVMTVQSCCFALSVKLLPFLISCPAPPHLTLPIIYDTFWSVRNRIFSVQIKLLLLIASETFFDSSVVPWSG